MDTSSTLGPQRSAIPARAMADLFLERAMSQAPLSPLVKAELRKAFWQNLRQYASHTVAIERAILSLYAGAYLKRDQFDDAREYLYGSPSPL